MNCEDIDQHIGRVLSSWQTTTIQLALKTKDWSALPEYADHISTCNDCQATVHHYLDIRDKINVEAHPCFHLASRLAEGQDIKLENGYYMIASATANSYHFINYCPWCGVKLPKTYRDIEDLYSEQ